MTTFDPTVYKETTREHRLGQLAHLTNARGLIFATSKSRWSGNARSRLQALQPTYPGIHIESYVRLLDPNGPVQDSV